jgi:tight adherence protein B
MFNFDSIYLVYLLISVSAAMFAEGLYLLVFNNASYRKNINRWLKVMAGKTDRESVLVQLRRERGLTSSGDYRLPLVSLNKLLLQSGLTIGFGRLILFIIVGATVTFTAMVTFEGNAFHAFLAALFSGFALPPLVLKFLRGRRQKKFSAQFPDGIDIILAGRPSCPDRDRDGVEGNAGSYRHRVRHCVR